MHFFRQFRVAFRLLCCRMNLDVPDVFQIKTVMAVVAPQYDSADYPGSTGASVCFWYWGHEYCGAFVW